MMLVMQQGGSSREFYPHLFDGTRDAERYRIGAEAASYSTSDPIKVPEALAKVLRRNPSAEAAFVELFGDAAAEAAGLV